MTPLCSPCLSRCTATRAASLTSSQRRKQIVRPSTVVCGGIDFLEELQAYSGDVCKVAICVPVASMAIAEFEIRTSLRVCRDLRQPVPEVERAGVVFTDSAGMPCRLDLEPPQFHTGGLVPVDLSNTLEIGRAHV